MKKIAPLVEKVPYDIDFIGTGTFQVSQLDVLQKRSIELNKTKDFNLSARGLHHRSRKHFSKEVRASSAIIHTMLEQGARDPKSNPKSSFYLMNIYFQRALGLERLGQLDRAIDDYSKCLEIEVNCAAAYFNRGGLLYSQGKLDAAINDLNKAVELEPANVTYRCNRAILLRRRGLFNEATTDTIMTRTLQRHPTATDDERNGNELEDPIISCLRKPIYDRVTCPEWKLVVEFLRGLKFFHSMSNDYAVMESIARQVSLKVFDKKTLIFEEGEPGSTFFMIYMGEVSIVKWIMKPNEKGEESRVRQLLTRLFRGQTFGETAITSIDGLRTAAAIATQKTYLLSMEAADYNRMLRQHRSEIRDEILIMLGGCPVFATWEKELLDKLADAAVLRSFSADTVILNAGEPVTTLFIVKRGVVKIVKSISRPSVHNIRISQFTTPDSVTGMENPGPWVLKKNWKDKIDGTRPGTRDLISLSGESGDELMDFTVGVLGSGQMFGELSILAPEQAAPTSAVAFTNAEVYVFDSAFLLSLGAKFNPSTINALNESLNLYNPPTDKIAHYYRSKYTWEQRKKKILQGLVRERPTIAGKTSLT